MLYLNISRSLFEKDRLLFAFTLNLKFMEYEGVLDSEQLRFLMTGGVSIDENYPPKPDASWILEKMWVELCRLS